MAETPPRSDLLAIAFEVAETLCDAGLDGPEGLTVIGMALGIYMEALKVPHPGMAPMAKHVSTTARATFNAFR